MSVRHEEPKRALAAALPRQRRRPVTPTPPHPEPPLVVDEDHQRWVARPRAAHAIQIVVLAVPVAASVVCAWLLSTTLPHATDVGAALLWWAIVVVGSTVTLFVVDRIARRLLPLAVLLRLSMLFPDQAPKRYRVAARAWSTRGLREQIEAGRPITAAGAPAEAATEIIRMLANLAMHDRRTRGHCERVRAYNDLLSEELGLSRADRDRLRWAALIHDIGKLDVPRRLLNKPGKPTAREWTVLKEHPARGARIAEPLAEWLGPWAPTIEQHHERWDGTGYPHGLASTDISLGARIVAVADAFEVMTSLRPYSRAVTPESARIELATCAGTHFDPMVVRAFLNISIGKLRKAMGPIVWFSQVPFLASMPRLEAAIIGGSQAAVGVGATAGVVAATTLGPGGTPAHHHAPPSLPVAAVSSAPSTPAAPAASAADPAHHASRPAVVAAHHHHHGHAAVRHTDSSPVAGHRHAATTHHARHDGHHSDPQPAATGPDTSGLDDATHGRCAGNSGAGLGNGGPRLPGLRDLTQMPLDAQIAHEHAPGLTACD